MARRHTIYLLTGLMLSGLSGWGTQAVQAHEPGNGIHQRQNPWAIEERKQAVRPWGRLPENAAPKPNKTGQLQGNTAPQYGQAPYGAYPRSQWGPSYWGPTVEDALFPWWAEYPGWGGGPGGWNRPWGWGDVSSPYGVWPYGGYPGGPPGFGGLW